MNINDVEFCLCLLGVKIKKNKITEYKNLEQKKYFFRVNGKFYDCQTFKPCPLSSSEAAFGEEYITKISRMDESKLEPDFLAVLNRKKEELLGYISVGSSKPLEEQVIDSLPAIQIYDYSFGTVVDEHKPSVAQIGVAVAVLYKEQYIDIMTGKIINASLENLAVGDVIGYNFRVVDFQKLDENRQKMLMFRVSQAINSAEDQSDSLDDKPIVVRKM